MRRNMKLRNNLSVGAIRHITVEITKPISLPRFKTPIGFKWNVNPYNFKEGGFNLGGGFVPMSDFKVIKVTTKNREGLSK